MLYRIIDLRGNDLSEIDQPETRIDYGDHVLLTDRNTINYLYRGPSIYAS